MTSCCHRRRMRWSGATGAIARCKNRSTGYARRDRSVPAWRWICGVKPKPKAVNKPSPHCIVHGLDRPGVFTTVSLFFLLCCRCCQALLSIFSPYHSLGAVSHRPDRSGGFLWRWDPSSPTTFYPCRRKPPSPDSLCVFRREPEVLSKATPSIRRLLCKARKFNGPPSPAPRPRRDSVPQNRLGLFEDGPLRYYPTFKEAPQ